jgi:hypothetical protein
VHDSGKCSEARIVKIIIRDDDTCGFTRPEEILSCYQQIWQEIPVSLSVTPFRIPGNDRNLPEHLNGKMEIFPLHKNQEIQQMLREGIREGCGGPAKVWSHAWTAIDWTMPL